MKIPKGARDKVPVIVFLHGGYGWSKTDERYLNDFNKMGIATFRLSCFEPRKVQGIVDKITNVPPEMMIADVYNALNLLSTHPRLDNDRIGLMGRSYGGMVTLLSAWEPVRKAMVKSDIKFAFHIALYSYCWQFEKIHMTGAPILILAGEKDDWVPTKLCVEFTGDLKAAGYDANIIVYPDAHHGFDGTSDLKSVSQGINTTKCRYFLKSNGVIIETTSGLTIDSPEMNLKAFESCMTRGTHIGSNKFARKKSMEDIKKFVTEIFVHR